jgi:hypothetical protein
MSYLVVSFSKENNNIMVYNLAEGGGPIPNPIRTFEQGFQHYRKLYFSGALVHRLSDIIAYFQLTFCVKLRRQASKLLHPFRCRVGPLLCRALI